MKAHDDGFRSISSNHEQKMSLSLSVHLCVQDHRRRVAQEAAAARAKQSSTHRQGFMGDREAAAGERKRRAAAAAAESERILREEQAKDADWRTNMMRQIEEVGMFRSKLSAIAAVIACI